MLETYKGVVYPNQLDHMGHMNVQWYTAKFDEATWHLFSEIGITSRYIEEQCKGMAALEQHIIYRAEVSAGALLSIRSEIIEISEKIIRFRHNMRNSENEQEVATCELTGIHFDLESRKSCPLPGFVSDMAALLKSQ
ncbi:MAG: thioesterase family protein [Candidatus Thiodiazotropha sp.]